MYRLPPHSWSSSTGRGKMLTSDRFRCGRAYILAFKTCKACCIRSKLRGGPMTPIVVGILGPGYHISYATNTYQQLHAFPAIKAYRKAFNTGPRDL